ncbi:MAG TPA: PDZ domain-containing protein [Pirellulales bacterium]
MAKAPHWIALIAGCASLAAGAEVASGQVVRQMPRASQSRPAAAPRQPDSGSEAASQRASLGVAMSDNTRGGVLILRVLPGSAAAAIGLQTGDRIMAIDGKSVSNYRDVARLVASYRPNTRVELKIDRGGWSKNVVATLGNASALAVPVAPTGPSAQALVAPPAPRAVTPGILAPHPYYEDETPADIDDQHGYGG